MKIFNTLTREKEEFVPIEPGKVKMYACGPTVYNFIHIGNARPICVFDTLRRYLEFRGYEVTFVQNFTDIDDKIIKKANEEGVSAKEIAERYINEYLTDTKGKTGRAKLDLPLGRGQTGLAHRMYCHDSQASGSDHRHPLRRTGFDFPTP